MLYGGAGGLFGGAFARLCRTQLVEVVQRPLRQRASIEDLRPPILRAQAFDFFGNRLPASRQFQIRLSYDHISGGLSGRIAGGDFRPK